MEQEAWAALSTQGPDLPNVRIGPLPTFRPPETYLFVSVTSGVMAAKAGHAATAAAVRACVCVTTSKLVLRVVQEELQKLVKTYRVKAIKNTNSELTGRTPPHEPGATAKSDNICCIAFADKCMHELMLMVTAMAYCQQIQPN